MKPTNSNALADGLTARVVVLFLFVGLMWVIHAIDAIKPAGTSVLSTGIVPRTWDGLKGIPVAPFIHENWDHLIANTLPLLILGALVVMRGVSEFIFVTGVIAAISGMGTWLFGSAGQHAGASGIVLGFTAFLLFRSVFDRRPSSFVVTVLVAITCATSVALSLIPRGSISWSLHFFGFIGGILAARLRYPHRPKTDPRVEAWLT